MGNIGFKMSLGETQRNQICISRTANAVAVTANISARQHHE